MENGSSLLRMRRQFAVGELIEPEPFMMMLEVDMAFSRGFMPHIPVRHPAGGLRPCKIAPGNFVERRGDFWNSFRINLKAPDSHPVLKMQFSKKKRPGGLLFFENGVPKGITRAIHGARPSGRATRVQNRILRFCRTGSSYPALPKSFQ